MLKIKAEKMKDLEKFGFRKHKQDKEDVSVSKWRRNWVEADTIDGYPIGSSGWEFYPSINIYQDRTMKIFVDSWGGVYSADLDILYDLIKADMVEKVVKDENHNK